MEGSPWVHLLQLLDDESPVVHWAVLGKLRELGTDPLAALDSEGVEINPRQRRRLLSCPMTSI